MPIHKRCNIIVGELAAMLGAKVEPVSSPYCDEPPLLVCILALRPFIFAIVIEAGVQGFLDICVRDMET